MKKSCLFLVSLFCLVWISASAQSAYMGVHVTSSFPSEDSPTSSNVSIGGGVSMDYYFNQFVNLGVEFNYLGFAFDTADVSITILPIQARLGLHLPVSESFDVYAGSGGGMFIQRYKSRIASLDQEILWGLTPRVGFIYRFADNVLLDVNANYAWVLSEGSPDDVSGIVSFNVGLAYDILAEIQ